MTETINSTAAQAGADGTAALNDHVSALRFITCGSVDDGKSTLIGRLLVDTRAVLQDQLAGVTKSGETDLALLTDGLSAEREQGITIDVAYRYFATESRKFIIGDAPGHEQYTRNMVTAASSADAAVVLVDATKLDWQNASLQLLPQTRRHSLLAHLLRVHSLVFAVNKLDAVADPALAFAHIRGALAQFAQDAGIAVAATIPVSALKGFNVVNREAGWAGYQGPSLLQLLEELPNTPADVQLPLAFPVQWVEKFHDSAVTTQGRRVFWGRVAAGSAQVGAQVQILPSGQLATIAQVIDHARAPKGVEAGLSAGITLDREVDVSRGDWIVAAPVQSAVAEDDFDTPAAVSPWPASRDITATVAWMDNEPLVPGRVYWALHGHRWVKAKARRVAYRLNINTLDQEEAQQLEANAIGQVELQLQEAIPAAPFTRARQLGSLILVDTASNATAGAALVR
ncbi:sulfate adenylyltransferase subunit 1 [Comamonas terrigena]|jgi:sulfate adenylyltransferase subunit 1|uniref:sulfate adenylyltransferase subunit 1 n=1 Tax=Comamonas terrigena TaxID=32013 RepID=UPI00244C02DB|nr:GTP-binding protein [Comamonas terrigena]MDH0048832.1 GTP-binding protein [Comamonas terrigena]MDH0511757.1 GTP-binding protein [Comamonas terrigena]MDH1091088.1 GTP-binding protein [Comamonas terrigena]MDH1500967.1 GTP-binding protein [Comamonas terrigena]